MNMESLSYLSADFIAALTSHDTNYFPIGSNAKGGVLEKPLFIQTQPRVSVIFSKSSF